MNSRNKRQKIKHLFKIAQQYQENSKNDDACKAYQEIIKLNPKHSQAWFNLGIIWQNNHLIDEAVKAFCEAAKLDSQYHGFLFSFGLTLVSNNLLEQAVVVMNFLLKLQPDVAEFHYGLGLIYFHQQQLAFAEQLFNKAIELKNDYPAAHKELGRVLMATSRNVEALDSFKQAVSLDPKCHEGFRFMGDINRELGRYSDAIEAYRAEQALNPSSVESLFDIGLTYLRQHAYDKAVAIFQQVVEKSPLLSEAHYNLGLSFLNQKKYPEAIKAYTSALAINSDNAAVHNDLGMIYDLRGQTDKAIEHYQKVVRIEPGNMVAAHILAALTGEQLQNAHPDYVASLFDQYSDSFESDVVTNLKYTVPSKLKKAVDDHLSGKIQFDNAIDLGCGTGMCGREFMAISTKITGVDISPKMIDFASRKNAYSSLAKQDMVRFLHNSNEMYDLFIAADVFIYVGALDSVFEIVQKKSLPQGYFTFSVERCDGSSFWLSPSGRYMHSREYIQKMADKYMFEVEQCIPTGIRIENNVWIPGDLYILKSNYFQPHLQAHSEVSAFKTN